MARNNNKADKTLKLPARALQVKEELKEYIVLSLPQAGQKSLAELLLTAKRVLFHELNLDTPGLIMPVLPPGQEALPAKSGEVEEMVIRIRFGNNRSIISATALQSQAYRIGRFIFRPDARHLEINNKKQSLTTRESEILKMLLDQKNEVVRRAALITRFWNEDSYFANRSLDVFITRIRNYLKGDSSVQLLNIRGVGYTLTD
jgi:hypothetical protein